MPAEKRGEEDMENNNITISVADYMDLIRDQQRMEIARDYLAKHLNDYQIELIIADILGIIIPEKEEKE